MRIITKLFFFILIPYHVWSQNNIDTLLYSSVNCIICPDREQNILFKSKNDTLNISGFIEANCCGEHFLIIRKTNDSIIMTRLDTGNLCDCTCGLEIDVNINISDCKSEPFRLVLTEYHSSYGIDTLIYRYNTFIIDNHIYYDKSICYPNPFYEYSIIRFSNSENKPFTFILADIYGKIIRIENDIIADEITINNEGLQSGMYIYNIINKCNNQNRFIGKMIKY